MCVDFSKMATAFSIASVLEKLSKGHLECPICCCRFVTPKLLNCSHSFCLNCLQQLMTKEGEGASSQVLVCPVCSNKTKLGTSGAAGLANNLSLSSIIDEVTNQEKIFLQIEGLNVICQACDEGQKAVSRCMDCEDYLCIDCQQAHQRLAKMKLHKLAPLSGSSSIEQWPNRKVNATPETPLTCNKHPGQDLSLFCEKCQILICAECISDHQQPGHKYQTTEEASVMFKQAVFKLMGDVKAKKTELIATRDMTIHCRSRLEFNMVDTKYKISKTADECIAYIRQQEKTLHTQVTTTGQTRVQQIKVSLTSQNDDLGKVENCLESTKSAMAQGDVKELLQQKANIMSNLESALKVVKKDQATLERLTTMNFTSTGNLACNQLVQVLGTVQL